jgi:hypothetical protein
MSCFLKFFDLFGVAFEFTTLKDTKYSSSLGGLITICCGLTILVFGFFFGQDFFYKKNPKIIQQTVYPEDYLAPIKLRPDNIIFPWRLVDAFKNPINFEGKVFPFLDYYQYTQNSTGSNLINFSRLYFKKCTKEIANVPEFYNNFNLDNYYCVDWNQGNFTFGGFADGNYTDMFTLRVSFCPGTTSFSPKVNCTDMEKVFSMFYDSKSVFFDLLYPEFYFNPEELDNPLKINFKSILFAMDPGLYKLERLLFTKIQLIDDFGWIVQDEKNYEKYGVVEKKTDYGITNWNYYNVSGVLSSFYNLSFNFQKSYIKINRSFMKLQDLAALIGGFMKLIFFIGGLLAKNYNYYSRNNNLYNIFFYLDSSSKEEAKNASIFKSKFSKLKKPNDQEDVSDNIKLHKINIFSNNKNPVSRRQIYPQLNLEATGSSLNFGFYFILKKLICLQKDKSILSIFEKIETYFKTKYDILYYMKTLNIIAMMKSVLFNKFQSICLDLDHKVNLADESQMFILESEIQREKIEEKTLIEYFSNKKENNELDYIDKRILDQLLPQIKNYI